MGSTFTQLYIHVVFSVKRRERLISKHWKEELYKYIAGIIANKKQVLYIINGDMDHVHILLGMSPDISISELVKEIKRSSSLFVNEKRLSVGRFSWQEGFGAFSIGKSEMSRIIGYIKDQEVHHHRNSFTEEYEKFLTSYGIEYKKEYLWKE
ncbi:MAG: IS200/IS605 family transposase [Ignavibacteria bacterium]|nr:IS200/IS605 family transposase [Ignavibacteria bacterium]